jgi:pSer/pThr/pTyr-binding forkhead associated (FHA) protein
MRLVFAGYQVPTGLKKRPGWPTWAHSVADGTKFELPEGGALTIGRGKDCDVVLLSNAIARKHALVVRPRRMKIVVVDLQSTNGLQLEGRDTPIAFLDKGDEFLLAHCFRFRVE